MERANHRPSRGGFEKVICTENNCTFDGSPFGKMPRSSRIEISNFRSCHAVFCQI
jgi:hypothetical protein